ncbi:MAG: TfuA-like protein, partial [Aestuariivirgaceae bacterium]
MTAVIFAGPSIRGLDLPSRHDVLFLTPAKQGDLFRAALTQPKAIGLIDGYFEGVPSVWHKEVLWALSQGIRVFGSSSMGALRAAELDAFGMVGIGRIYQLYRDCILEDDDEVALIHGPAESGFMPLSEPMVDVRATCEAAAAAGIIARQTAETIVAAAKLLNFRERSWNGIIAAASGQGAGLDEFARWLPAGRVDQKRLDASALISTVVACLDEPMPPQIANFRFEWTYLWDEAVDEWAAGDSLLGDAQSVSASAVLDELRLEPDRYVARRAEAVQRAVLLREAERRRLAADRAGKRHTLARLREGLGLLRKSELDAWVKNQGLTPDEFEILMDEETRIESVQIRSLES